MTPDGNQSDWGIAAYSFSGYENLWNAGFRKSIYVVGFGEDLVGSVQGSQG